MTPPKAPSIKALAKDLRAGSRAALARAITLGWLWRHESGTYVKFTEAGADLFA